MLLTTGKDRAVIIQDIRESFRGKKFYPKDLLQLPYTEKEIKDAIDFMVETEEVQQEKDMYYLPPKNDIECSNMVKIESMSYD